MQFGDIILAVHQVHVQTLYRQRGDGIEVIGNAFKVGGQQQLNLAAKRLVSRFEGIQPRLRQFQYQRRLINLHPFNAAFCQFSQHLLVNRQNIVQQAQAVERLAFNLTEPQVSNRPEQDGFRLVTQRQCFIHFIQQLGPGQFEPLALYEFRHHVVVVGIKPFGHFRRRSRFAGRRAATANAEQGIDINGAVFVLMTSRHVTKQQAGGQNMVVPGEIAYRQQVNAGLLLLSPVTSAQLAADSQQFFAAGIARPVAFLRFLQLATQANARETEGVVNYCHFLSLIIAIRKISDLGKAANLLIPGSLLK